MELFLRASDFDCIRTIPPINLEKGDIVECPKNNELIVITDFLSITEKNVIVECCPIFADGSIATTFGGKKLIKKSDKCKIYGKELL